MSKPLQVLMVEDSEDDTALIARELNKGGFDSNITRVQTAEGMKKVLGSKKWDIILSDYRMPGFNGLQALEILKESGADIPFILISGTIGESLAVEAMRAGCCDYVMKDKLDRLDVVIERELREARIRLEKNRAEEALGEKVALLEKAHELARLGSYTIDLQSQTIFLSAEMARLYGAGDKAIRLPLVEYRKRFYHPDEFERSSKLANDAYKSGRPLTLESRVVRTDGSVIWVQSRSDNLPDGKTVLGMVQDITERKNGEDDLRSKTALLEAQLNSSIDGILIVDPNGKKILQNRRTVELWKIPQDIADNVDDATQVQHVMHSTKNPDKFAEKIAYLYNHPNETTQDEVELTNGTILERYSAPVFGKDRKNYGRIWMFHDITERKQAEEALHRNSRDMDFLSRSAMALVKVTAEEDVYQYIGELLKQIVPENSVAAVSEFDESSRMFRPRNIIGLDKTIGVIKKIIGKDPMELSGDFGPAAKKALLSGKLQKIDVGLHDFAQIIPVNIAHAVEKLLGIKAFFAIGFVKDGKVLGGLSIFLRKESALANSGVIEAFAAQAAIAIAKRKAEQLLRDNEARYRTLFDDARDGIALADAETGRIVECNQALCGMAGMDKSELVGQMQSIIHPPENLVKGQLAAFAQHRTDDAGTSVEDWIISKSGASTPVEIKAAHVRMNGRDYMLGVFRDITERKQHESEKEKLLSQLLQAQKMEAMGTLAGGVAHDFNNLLCAISGYTTLAMGKINEADPVQRDLRQVSTAAEKAAGVVRQLLLFSRKQHMEPMPMDVNAAITRLLKMLDRLIGEDIVIETGLEKGVWTILGDEGNIEQMLMNLAVNARDAMSEGGKIFMKTENVTIDEEYCRTSKTARPGRFVRISVSDTGTGMDELTQEHIFEPFFTTKPAGKGTGLGLSVVFGIVQQHKGWINVYSEPGHGTTFSAYFPAASSAAPEQQSKEKAGTASLEGQGERIMIVEDQAEVRAIAKELLFANGYSVFSASTAKEAMELFEKENGKFDLVFSDVVLPDRSGIQLVQDLLKRGKFRVLITSGYTDEKAHWDFIKENNYRFLHKPYAVRGLLEAVREALDGGGGG